jgi:hypothetical protein
LSTESSSGSNTGKDSNDDGDNDDDYDIGDDEFIHSLFYRDILLENVAYCQIKFIDIHK